MGVDGRMLGEAFSSLIFIMLLAGIAFGIAVTLFAIKVIPWLWHLIKPWVHTVTA